MLISYHIIVRHIWLSAFRKSKVINARNKALMLDGTAANLGRYTMTDDKVEHSCWREAGKWPVKHNSQPAN